MKHDLLHIQGKPYVLVPLHEYRQMTGGEANDRALPADILDALTAGQDSPVKILRKFRNLTQEALAEAAGLSRPYLTEIEKGRKAGSVKALRNLAQALEVDAKHLIS